MCCFPGGRSSWAEPLPLKSLDKAWMASQQGHRHSIEVMKAKFWFVARDRPRGDLNLNTSCPSVCIVQKGFWSSRSIPRLPILLLG